MPIRDIVVNQYKTPIGGNSEIHVNAQYVIQDIIRAKLINTPQFNTLDIYKLLGEYHSHNSGIKNQRMVIFLNATREGANESNATQLDEPMTIDGIENQFLSFLPPTGNGIIIESENGIPLAEWHEDTWELNILFDLFTTVTQEQYDIFKFIMAKFDELILFPKTLENSWVHTSNKDALTKNFSEQIKQQKEAILREEKRRLQNDEESHRNYKREIKTVIDRIERRRRLIATEEAHVGDVLSGLTKDLDLIVGFEKIKDLHIKDGKFIIFTNPLYIHVNDKRYYGGSYRIEIEPEHANVKFFGDNPRRSYWSGHDPHPHVSGNSGEACLGNVDSTIAELCSQMQIYPLVLICIDFLESANTSDSAGKYVTNWDEVDEEDNVINRGQGDTGEEECEECGEYFNEIYEVYGGIDEDADGQYPTDSRYVCNDCRENYYTFDDDVNEYIRD